jgi:hypothetical protein
MRSKPFLSGLILFAVSQNAWALPANTSVLVFSNTTTPDSPSVFSFSTPDAVLNDAGVVGFASDYTDSSGFDGTYLASVYGITKVARTNDVLDPPWEVDDTLNTTPRINAASQLGMRFTLDTTTNGNANDYAVLRGDASGVTALLAQGHATPTPDTLLYFNRTVSVPINQSGQLAFSAGLYGEAVGGSNDQGIYRFNNDGSLTEIVREGQATPNGQGTFNGTAFQSWSAFATPGLNHNGSVAFTTEIDASGTYPDYGIYRYDDDAGDGSPGLTRIVRKGDAWPGGGTFDSVVSTTVKLNDAGLVAFAADVSGTNSSRDGIFVGDGVTITKIAEAYQAVPGSENLSTFGSAVDLNNNGDVAFETSGNGYTRGVYLKPHGASIIPLGLTDAALPNADGTFNSIIDFSLNEAGQVAFSAYTTEGQGLYFYNGTSVSELVRVGDSFLGSTIDALGFAGSVYDDASGLNNNGQIAFSFSLANGVNGIALIGASGLITGDTDGDGDIDDADLGTAFANYSGPAGSTARKTPSQGDADGDGDIDDADLGLAFAGYTGPIATAVPEPAGLAVLGLGSLMIGRGRRG